MTYASKNNVTVAVPIFKKLIIDKSYHMTFCAIFQSNHFKKYENEGLKFIYVIQYNMTVPVHILMKLVFALQLIIKILCTKFREIPTYYLEGGC